MIDGKKNVIIVGSVLSVMLIVMIILAIFGLNLGFIKVASVSDILNKKSEVETANSALQSQEKKYSTITQKLKAQQKTFQDEKAKYEAISDETVAIIKEATKEENYSMEYMWIKLGNYASKNNLSLIVNDSESSSSTNTSEKTDATANTNTNTNGTNSGTTTNTNTTGGTTTTGTTGTNTTTGTAGTTNNGTNTTSGTAGATNSGTNTTGGTTGGTGSTTPTPGATTGNTGTLEQTTDNSGIVLKIQVTGSYIDVSDFIFEVENDKELMFKLDNISIDYVSGTTIKANFDVKNLVIKK